MQSKDVEPSLDMKESPQSGNDKMVDLSVESRLAKDYNMENAELSLSIEPHKDIGSPLSEAKVEQPLADNKLDDAEPFVESVLGDIENLSADVRELERLVVESGILELVEPEVAPSDSVDVEAQSAKSDDREEVEPPVAVQVVPGVASSISVDVKPQPRVPEQVEPPVAPSDSLDVKPQSDKLDNREEVEPQAAQNDFKDFLSQVAEYDDFREEVEPPVATAGKPFNCDYVS